MHIGLAAALIGVLVGSQFLLPPFFERRLERAIAQSSGGAALVSVQLTAAPAISLVTGSVRALAIDVRGATFGDLPVAAFLFDGRHLVVDVPRLLRGGGFALRHAERFNATLALREEDLNRYLWQKVDPSRQFRIELLRDGIHLAGRVSVLGFGVDVRVAGRFVVKDRTKIAFEPDEVALGQTRLPAFLQRMLAERWGMLIDLSSAPVPLELSELRSDQGMLFVYAHQPAGVPGAIAPR